MSQERTLTFVNPTTGNVCLALLKGSRGGLSIVDASWHRPPTKKDQWQFEAWFQKEHPAAEFGQARFFSVPAAEARAVVIDLILGNGGRN